MMKVGQSLYQNPDSSCQSWNCASEEQKNEDGVVDWEVETNDKDEPKNTTRV
jgi:hypothetical protein